MTDEHTHDYYVIGEHDLPDDVEVYDAEDGDVVVIDLATNKVEIMSADEFVADYVSLEVW